jgi:peptidoglycan/xylan/chitin deacetylase (PgdA/CDA1 family)
MRTPAAAQPALSILMYHQIGPYPSPTAHRALFCHIRSFRRQLFFLRHAGYRVLSLAQAHEALFGGGALPPKGVVLTVDDGYQDFCEHAWPALQEYGFPATVFLVSSQIGRTAQWISGTEGGFDSQPRLMDAATIRRLHREGVNFGSHALTHPRLSTLGPAQMRAEIFDSKAALQDLLGAEVPDFCYPYGDYNERARDLVQEAGYRSGLTCIRGAANYAANPYEIPRKAISYGDNLIGYAWKLNFKHVPKRQP